MRAGDRWQEFWSDKREPLHRRDTDEFYRRHAHELKLLLLERPLQRVLEIGCGNGALFDLLGFDQVDYTGVDFSPTMIDAFTKRHSGARLIVARGEDYRDDDELYDLIFANGVVQYLDEDGYERWLANAASMVAPAGCVVAASIPWRTLRLWYYTGALTGQRTTLPRSLYRIVAGVAADRIGRWYSFAEVERAGRRHGLRSEFFGSVHYPYRFHVRMTRMT